MKLSDLRTILRIMVPGANLNRISNDNLLTLLNKAVREINDREQILRETVYFDAAADDGIYSIDDDIDSDMIRVGESGVWCNRGTADSPNYDQLDSVNRAWLDANYPNWYNDTTGANPQFAFQEGRNIYIYPLPAAALSDGFLIPDAIMRTVDMTADNHYPFTGSATERIDLLPLDDAILDYVRFILKHAVASDQKGIITREEYEKTLKRAAMDVRSRPDYKTSFAWTRGYAHK